MAELHTPGARLLYRVMAGLSEDYWRAGWLSGCEYALWADLTGEETFGDKGWRISDDEQAELRLAHDVAGGWIVWSDEDRGERFPTDAEWAAHLADRRTASTGGASYAGDSPVEV